RRWRSYANRLRPRWLISFASFCIDFGVMIRPSPFANEASALSTAIKMAARARSLSSHNDKAS
ncbi:MAG TPA: hypothetical protein VKU42_07965, partial [Candidatus Angelobacter sp.]|nr:hypothetical protein [Candidatus Angelobacter sp.]